MDSRFCAICNKPRDTPEYRRSRFQQQAALQNPQTPAEHDAFAALYAYEDAQTRLHGRAIRAARTWPKVREKGIIAVVEGIVTRDAETEGFRVLADMGLESMLFESVVLKYPELFSADAIAKSKERLEKLDAERAAVV